MKKKLTLTTVIAAFFLFSCEPAATFNQPQPNNVSSLESFPEHMKGKYLDTDHTSIVTITDQLITRYYDLDSKTHKDSLPSSYKLSGDTLINTLAGTKEKITLQGDTVITHTKWNDTIFYISNDNILKKFKGYYFLNSRYEDSTWEVKKLSLEKGVLTVSSIFSQEDIQKLREITETTNDSTSTQFSPTKQQFKTFVDRDGFSAHETFTRMAADK